MAPSQYYDVVVTSHMEHTTLIISIDILNTTPGFNNLISKPHRLTYFEKKV